MQTVNIIIAGPHGAGKTTFIKTLRETTDKLYEDQQSVDFGRISVDDDLLIHLFGAPGHRRFDFIWEILFEGALGYVLMIDSTRPETFAEARKMMWQFAIYVPVPFVIAANKQDLPGAISGEDLRRLFSLNPLIPALSCIATDYESAKQVLLELLYQIVGADFEEAAPVEAAVLTPVLDTNPIVTRATLDDCQRIAAFLSAAHGGSMTASYVRQGIFTQFGLFLATLDGQLVGVGQFYVDNFVAGIKLTISPQAGHMTIGAALLDAIHRSARELEAELAVVMSVEGLEDVFAAQGYQRTKMESLEHDDWKKTIKASPWHRGAGAVWCLTLREDQVTKPI